MPDNDGKKPGQTGTSSFWIKTRSLTGWLIALWFLSTLAAVFFARELGRINLFGWPLPFYMAAQGLPLLYLGIVAFYARRMHHLGKALDEDTTGAK